MRDLALQFESKKIDLSSYKTIVFDCDGVILNSNKIKVQAYFEVAKRNGGSDAQAQALADHHVQKGSFPRDGKIAWYFENVLKQPATPQTMQPYLDSFEVVLDEALMTCEIAQGLLELKAATPQAKWMLLSGGDQAELRKIFARRKLNDVSLVSLFEVGIFGGPDIKEQVLPREIANGNLQLPALFVGDSKYDHQAAKGAGLDFVFLSGWTEVRDWQEYCAQNSIIVLESLSQLI